MTLVISPTDSVSRLLHVIDPTLVPVLPKPPTTRTAKGLLLSGAQCDEARGDANERHGSGDGMNPKRKRTVHARKRKRTKPPMQLQGHAAKAHARLVIQHVLSDASWNDQKSLLESLLDEFGSLELAIQAEADATEGPSRQDEEFDDYMDFLLYVINDSRLGQPIVEGNQILGVIVFPTISRLTYRCETERPEGYDDVMNHCVANGEGWLDSLREEPGLCGRTASHHMDPLTSYEFYVA